MEYHEKIDKVREIGIEAAHGNMDSVDLALETAMRRLKRLSYYEEVQEWLVIRGMRDVINQERHSMNITYREQIRGRLTGEVQYVPPEKRRSSADTMERTLQEIPVFDYAINGMRIGSLTGADIPILVGKERVESLTHTFHVKWLEAMSPLISKGKTLEECVDKKDAERIRDEVYNKVFKLKK